MPYLYRTGVGHDGRSCILDRQEIDLHSDPVVVSALDEAVTAVPASGSTAALLESMTGPGGWFGNIFAWKPGMYTDLHRTVTVDFDVVLAGSVELLLEVGSATLGPGDCVLLPGTVHAWKAGPDGGLMAFTMVAGEATGGDVGRDRLPHSTITHGA